MSINNQIVMAEDHEAEDDSVPALPPGYRFYPTEEELIAFYLHRKLDHGNNTDTIFNSVIPVVQIYDADPWQLPEISGELCHREKEQWFFFTPRQEREARGGRPNRTTTSGYWKATGSPNYVYSSPSTSSTTRNSNHRVIGVKKTMVFYKGKAPTGRKTKWKMNEYRAIMRDVVVGANQVHHHNQISTQITTLSATSTPVLRHEFCLCRIYVKSGFLRAFDRRPLGPTTFSEPIALTRYNQHHSVAVDYNDQKTSSTSYHSSGDDHIQNQSSSREVGGEGSTSATTTRDDDQSDIIIPDRFNQLWDWEQLKWV